MPSLSYHDDFAQPVADGDKRQTIRALRKIPVKQGDILYHFTGMRRPGCRRLCYSIAEEVHDIDIFAPMGRTAGKVFVDKGGPDNQSLSHFAIQVLAIADGFESVEAFYGWFVTPTNLIKRSRSRFLDFHFFGQLIKWPTSWTPAKCPKCGDTPAACNNGQLWCSSCDHLWYIGGKS